MFSQRPEVAIWSSLVRPTTEHTEMKCDNGCVPWPYTAVPLMQTIPMIHLKVRNMFCGQWPCYSEHVIFTYKKQCLHKTVISLLQINQTIRKMSNFHVRPDIFIVVLLMMQVSWNAVLCHWMISSRNLLGQAGQEELSLHRLLHPEDEPQSSDTLGTIHPMT